MEAIVHFLEDVVHFAAEIGITLTELVGIAILLITVGKAIVGYFRKDEHIRLDLAEGIGKDRAGIRYLAQCGTDGVISTKAQLIRYAKEQGLITVQRFFALDSKGMESIEEMSRNTNPHLMEIMPGVICKAISRFSSGGIPVIAGGLIQTKSEVTDALGCGAAAVSTGRPELWYM